MEAGRFSNAPCEGLSRYGPPLNVVTPSTKVNAGGKLMLWRLVRASSESWFSKLTELLGMVSLRIDSSAKIFGGENAKMEPNTTNTTAILLKLIFVINHALNRLSKNYAKVLK
jgi:hypothetical protein